MIIVDKFHKYCEDEFNLSELDSVKLKYSLEVLFGDLSKFLILLILFSTLDSRMDFIYSSLTLFTIRIFTGGLHFKTYTGCLVFSGLFFYLSIFLKNSIILNNTLVIAFFLISILIVFTVAPVCEKSRPTYSYKKRLQFKLIGTLFILIHVLGYFFTKNNMYFINSMWIVLLQSIQILIAKGDVIYENYKISCKKTI